MNWDDPDNFQFPIDVLCAERKRIKTIFENTWLQGTTYSYKGYCYWQQLWSDRYAPNGTIDAWLPAYRGDLTIPPYYPGPNFAIASVVPNWINKPEYADYLPQSILEELQIKLGWEELPEWEYVVDTISAQILTDTVTPFPPYWGAGGYYREEFVNFVLGRSKKIYEFDYPFPHLGLCFLGSGRVAPSVEENRPELEYKNWVYFVTNTEVTKVTLYMVKCGCLCCPPCGCNKPATAPGEG
jgi:hypothetical protein